jgi:hypothetical protein
MTTIELPSLLFPLALAIPFLRPPRPIRALGWLGLGRFGVWAVGSQQIRFLLPLFPLAALLTAVVLTHGWDALEPRPGLRVLVPAILIGGVASTLAYQIIFLASTRPAPVVIGAETKDSFLERAVYDYTALRFVRDGLPPAARVVMLWDGQGFYADDRTLPDTDQSRWVQTFEASGDAKTALSFFASEGFTHVLVDYEGASFLLGHDPTRRHARALAALQQAVSDHRLEPSFQSEKVTVFRIVATPSGTGSPVSAAALQP